MDDREPYGRIVRRVWVDWAKEQDDPKASWLAGWDELDDGQREVDMRIGSVISMLAAAAERGRAEGKLAEVRETAETFLAHYGHSVLPTFKVALDLAHGVLQVTDKKPPEGSEEENR